MTPAVPHATPSSAAAAATDTAPYDVAVVGAGVVGCAIARRLALEGARVVVLEKAADVLAGASKANSAILHTGFDAPPGTLEAACIAAGHAEYRAIHDRLGLPLIETGALVIAWNETEAARLPALMADAERNDVPVHPLTAAEIRRMEPNLGAGVAGGFRVAGEAIIDPWSTPHAYLAQALANGAALMTGAEVTGGTFDGAAWTLAVAHRDAVRARVVVNAAGLFGDRVEAALLGASSFQIRPRKGQFIVYDKPAAALAGHILLPVPTEITKGVVVCRTAFGNLLVGPTAEEQEDRTTAALDAALLERLKKRAEAIVPALEGETVTALYAGLRPASEAKEYRVAAHPDRRYVAVGGIRSTGLSAALGLAVHIHGLVAGMATGVMGGAAPADPVWPRVPNIAEGAPRDWERPGNGGIVCHCESVTRREIEAALAGPLGARTVAGLKRRTRVTMGRCQGFYCSAALAALTDGRLAEPFVPAHPTPLGAGADHPAASVHVAAGRALPAMPADALPSDAAPTGSARAEAPPAETACAGAARADGQPAETARRDAGPADATRAAVSDTAPSPATVRATREAGR
ncbi:FAD-dependent oxidoreductase [Acuticoccus yangtzensis]|uniref:FAD-dependent oxidoreductase n=1 Tax=Acuticoccus yangtzensis TaxID=1443441 RepID=UPI0009FAC386